MLFCIKFTLAKLFFCARAKEPKPVRGFRFPRTPKRPRRGVKPQQNSLYSLFRFCFNDFSAFRVAAHTPQIFCVGFAKIGTLYKGTYCTDFTPLHTEKSLKPNCAHKKVEFLHSLTSPLSHIQKESVTKAIYLVTDPYLSCINHVLLSAVRLLRYIYV